jgi:hypothetical protein
MQGTKAMATTSILGLFTSPEEYQQQRDLMAQRQAAELAQLDPYQSINYGAIRAGQQFGRGLAGILGAEDPQLRMISTRQSALQGINLADPESIFTAAQQLAGAGDQQGALMLADYGRKAQADKALAEQRTRERMSPALQAAGRVRELTTAKQKLLTEGVSAESPEIKIIEAEIDSLSRGGRGTGQVPDTIEIANARADARGLAVGSEARNKFLDEEIGRLSSKDTTQKLSEFERILDKRYPDTPANAQIRATLLDQYLKSEIEGKATGKGTKVEIGGIRVDTGKAGEAAGKKLGEELVDVKGKESALDSIADAKSILKQGIYAGAYGPTKQFVAKYTGVGSPDKVANTETFLAFIGETVVPRLKEFGGNDSEQELAYLNRIMGGDISVEPKALERILNQAEIKIKRGIERLRRQAESGEKKQPLTSTLPPPEAPAPAAPAAPAAPRPTKRWNPNTRRLEAIQ